MLKKLTIMNTASYAEVPQELSNLKKCNYIYGSNGSGKTTISNAIRDNKNTESISIEWDADQKLNSFVYNTGFVKENFHPSEKIKGIFTLGKQEQELLDKINILKIEINKSSEEILKLSKNLENEDESNLGQKNKKEKITNKMIEEVWKQKIKYEGDFKESFVGLLNNKKHFFKKALEEFHNNKANLCNYKELLEKSKTIFGDPPKSHDLISLIKDTEILDLEKDEILYKKIIGKNDVDIAAMIKKLNNSDWVKQGYPFLESNDNKTCPFCQQEVDESLSKQLNEYFDETYINDLETLKFTITNYKLKAENLIESLKLIIDIDSNIIPKKELEHIKELLETKYQVNENSLKQKLKEPSSMIELEDTSELHSKLYATIEKANDNIKEHNKIVANYEEEKSKLIKEIWKFIIETEIKNSLSQYTEQITNFDKAINSLKRKIEEEKALSKNKSIEQKKLEDSITSITPTVNAINRILEKYGYTNFSLKEDESEKTGFYKIIRPDGSDAHNTLSEGEKHS